MSSLPLTTPTTPTIIISGNGLEEDSITMIVERERKEREEEGEYAHFWPVNSESTSRSLHE